ncbi:hypothetical protein [Prescottella agglutinans]|uniref:Uncharacterized protein n=1 Tax=Prescottella agglutinans TaxID=1644129 RepID=A0ABT6MFM7_9NOCA|nr:hypothetical protein [Prescottella agglutinans]MDH6283125.1 hypothetical protein [Prescottella agglutinans]
MEGGAVVEFSAAGHNLDEYLRNSSDLRDHVLEVCELGADYWARESRWRTGFNATHIEASTDNEGAGGNIRGVVYASGHYARYREHGTRYNEAEHLLQDVIDWIEHT